MAPTNLQLSSRGGQCKLCAEGMRSAWTLSSLRLVEETSLVWEDLGLQDQGTRVREGERPLGTRAGKTGSEGEAGGAGGPLSRDAESHGLSKTVSALGWGVERKVAG